MTDNEMRIAIAEACGWEYRRSRIPATMTEDAETEQCWHSALGVVCNPPDYPNDLNAMYEAEKTLKNNSSFQIGCQGMYINILNDMCGSHFFPTIHATARQRSEAFLRTLGLWKD